MTAPTLRLPDIALTRLHLWHSSFRPLPGQMVFMVKPRVDLLIHPRTWWEYRKELLMSDYLPPKDGELVGHRVLLSADVAENDVRLVVSS